MLRAGLLLAALSLTACTYQASVPTVDGSSLAAVGARQPGSFAALVQTGGWAMETQVVGFSCSANTYRADLNPSWDQAMKAAFKTALESVAFVSATLPSPELASRGYDAQLGVMQSNASSKLQVSHGFFRRSALAETRLEGILTIAYPDGTRQQETLLGQGTARARVAFCSDVGPSIEASSAGAIRDIVQRAAATAKLLLAQRRAATPSAQLAPLGAPAPKP